LLNISGKIDNDTVKLLGVVDQVAKDMGTPYLIVGATARDLVMHYGYGAPVRRATGDLDFAIQLADWDAYTHIADSLVELDFEKGIEQQRFYSPTGVPVDIVPFGDIADEASDIKWPPPGETVMNVTGFEEAHACAIQVTVRVNPILSVPVAAPQGLVLLKLIAWNDRTCDLRPKDAQDIAYLLATYQDVPQILERAYDIEGLMDSYDWDMDLATAHLLGLDSAGEAKLKTKGQVIGILDKNLTGRTSNHLVEEMCSRGDDDYPDKLSRLEAFSNGFRA
jgi:predicted nucleotidyltransferase